MNASALHKLRWHAHVNSREPDGDFGNSFRGSAVIASTATAGALFFVPVGLSRTMYEGVTFAE